MEQQIGITIRTAFIAKRIAQYLAAALGDGPEPSSSSPTLLQGDPRTLLIKSYCQCKGGLSYDKLNLFALKRVLIECGQPGDVAPETIRAICPETTEDAPTEAIQRDLTAYAEKCGDAYREISDSIRLILLHLDVLLALQPQDNVNETPNTEETPMNVENGPPVADKSVPTTLIGRLRQEYLNAMNSIDTQSGEEIKSGQEMKGIVTFMTALNKLSEIHEQLSKFYGALFRSSDVLKRNDSKRLKQLGHDMLPTLDLLKDVDFDDETKEKYVVAQFHKLGLHGQHWYLKERFLLEIKYMLDALSILVEPEFMPVVSVDSSSEDETDRYIPSEVKLNVWRRDQGKCVQCGSKEKLEYDHIIPVSKGGSNTERNIELLCQTCNRKKAAAIQ